MSPRRMIPHPSSPPFLSTFSTWEDAETRIESFDHCTSHTSSLHEMVQGKGADSFQLFDFPEVCWGAGSARYLAGRKGDAGDCAADAATPAGALAPRQSRPLLLCSCRYAKHLCLHMAMLTLLVRSIKGVVPCYAFGLHSCIRSWMRAASAPGATPAGLPISQCVKRTLNHQVITTQHMSWSTACLLASHGLFLKLKNTFTTLASRNSACVDTLPHTTVRYCSTPGSSCCDVNFFHSQPLC